MYSVLTLCTFNLQSPIKFNVAVTLVIKSLYFSIGFKKAFGVGAVGQSSAHAIDCEYFGTLEDQTNEKWCDTNPVPRNFSLSSRQRSSS